MLWNLSKRHFTDLVKSHPVCCFHWHLFCQISMSLLATSMALNIQYTETANYLERSTKLFSQYCRQSDMLLLEMTVQVEIKENCRKKKKQPNMLLFCVNRLKRFHNTQIRYYTGLQSQGQLFQNKYTEHLQQMPHECKLSLYYFNTNWIKTKIKT